MQAGAAVDGGLDAPAGVLTVAEEDGEPAGVGRHARPGGELDLWTHAIHQEEPLGQGGKALDAVGIPGEE